MNPAELIEHCYEAGWSDGLPVVPPTPDLVAAMLGGRDPDEIVAALPPSRGVATNQKLAANAVMAGCLPEHMPVLLAAVRAAASEEFGADELLTSLHSASPVLVVHGPIAEALGVNGGTGALGPGFRSNATIGRALLLCFRNIGGVRPDGLAPKTLGHPGGIGYCFAENRELSPWDPLHVERGFDPASSAVTVYGGDAPLCIAELGRRDPEEILGTLTASLLLPGTYNAFFRDELWLVMSPEHARYIADAGWTKRDVQVWIHEHAVFAAGSLRNRGLHGFGDEAYESRRLGNDDQERVPLTRRPESVVVLVAGGAIGGYTAAIFGIGRSVTERVAS